SHEPEMPTRFAKQLVLIFRGALAIGIERRSAMTLALRCARDSIPPIRLAVLRDLADNDIDDCRVTAIAKRLRKPWTTIWRTLDALYVLGLVECIERDRKSDESNEGDESDKDNDKSDNGKKSKKIQHYTLAADVNLKALGT